MRLASSRARVVLPAPYKTRQALLIHTIAQKQFDLTDESTDWHKYVTAAVLLVHCQQLPSTHKLRLFLRRVLVSGHYRTHITVVTGDHHFRRSLSDRISRGFCRWPIKREYGHLQLSRLLQHGDISSSCRWRQWSFEKWASTYCIFVRPPLSSNSPVYLPVDGSERLYNLVSNQACRYPYRMLQRLRESDNLHISYLTVLCTSPPLLLIYWVWYLSGCCLAISPHLFMFTYLFVWSFVCLSVCQYRTDITVHDNYCTLTITKESIIKTRSANKVTKNYDPIGSFVIR